MKTLYRSTWNHEFSQSTHLFKMGVLPKKITSHILSSSKLHSTLCGLLFVTLLLTGCSTTRFKESADKEVYAIINDATPSIPGMPEEFNIDRETILDLDDLSTISELHDFLGEQAVIEQGAFIISLEKALELAFKNNRSYQNQKEILYLTALSLTLERYRYTPIFRARGSGAFSHATRDEQYLTVGQRGMQAAPALLQSVSDLTGSPGDMLSRYATVVEAAAAQAGTPSTRIVDDRRVSGNTQIGASMLMMGGAQIAVDLTSNFLRYLTGDPNVTTSSALVGSISQPLLRGAGSKVAAERLTQAERDLLYELRNFTRFRQEFSINIASTYYRVLQNRDSARNNFLGYESFMQGSERQRALAEAGRLTESDLARTVQAELNSLDSWNNSVRAYSESLDQFKIQLGLSTDAMVVLDDNELEELRERGLIMPVVVAEDAIDVALATRLDYYTTMDQVEDAERRLYVASNALLPDLDLILTANVDTKPGMDRFSELDFRRARWNAGFDLSLPVDQKSERNAYRSALITYERAIRSLELSEDNIKLEVRRAWRELEQAERSFQIRMIGVEVNERRVEEQELLAQAGRATTLDQVDAQNDLVSARNALTAALINHTIARLEFFRDMGILYIKENGQWEDVTDVDFEHT